MTRVVEEVPRSTAPIPPWRLPGQSRRCREGRRRRGAAAWDIVDEVFEDEPVIKESVRAALTEEKVPSAFP
ncbi:MAG: hypothetical protein ACLTYW_05775 [Collinsella sp.]